MAAGRLWRAKEILQGRLRTAGYDAALYERYGNVLRQMGDLPEAGKYLFLSGTRRPEYRESIRIYLDRHGKTLRTLHDTFPACVRRTGAASYPEGVLTDLQAAGWSLRDLKIASRKDAPADSPRWDLLVGIAIAVVFLALFAGFLIQGLRGIGWLSGYFSSG